MSGTFTKQALQSIEESREYLAEQRRNVRYASFSDSISDELGKIGLGEDPVFTEKFSSGDIDMLLKLAFPKNFVIKTLRTAAEHGKGGIEQGVNTAGKKVITELSPELMKELAKKEALQLAARSSQKAVKEVASSVKPAVKIGDYAKQVEENLKQTQKVQDKLTHKISKMPVDAATKKKRVVKELSTVSDKVQDTQKQIENLRKAKSGPIEGAPKVVKKPGLKENLTDLSKSVKNNSTKKKGFDAASFKTNKEPFKIENAIEKSGPKPQPKKTTERAIFENAADQRKQEAAVRKAEVKNPTVGKEKLPTQAKDVKVITKPRKKIVPKPAKLAPKLIDNMNVKRSLNTSQKRYRDLKKLVEKAEIAGDEKAAAELKKAMKAEGALSETRIAQSNRVRVGGENRIVDISAENARHSDLIGRYTDKFKNVKKVHKPSPNPSSTAANAVPEMNVIGDRKVVPPVDKPGGFAEKVRQTNTGKPQSQAQSQAQAKPTVKPEVKPAAKQKGTESSWLADSYNKAKTKVKEGYRERSERLAEEAKVKNNVRDRMVNDSRDAAKASTETKNRLKAEVEAAKKRSADAVARVEEKARAHEQLKRELERKRLIAQEQALKDAAEREMGIPLTGTKPTPSVGRVDAVENSGVRWDGGQVGAEAMPQTIEPIELGAREIQKAVKPGVNKDAVVKAAIAAGVPVSAALAYFGLREDKKPSLAQRAAYSFAGGTAANMLARRYAPNNVGLLTGLGAVAGGIAPQYVNK